MVQQGRLNHIPFLTEDGRTSSEQDTVFLGSVVPAPSESSPTRRNGLDDNWPAIAIPGAKSKSIHLRIFDATSASIQGAAAFVPGPARVPSVFPPP
jgi:hypothetical protein